MNRQHGVLNTHLLAFTVILLIPLLSGCAQPTYPCPSQPLADLSGALAYAADDQLQFRFPLDELGNTTGYANPAVFCTSSVGARSDIKYHAAEDYHQPAGTPVYAMADGMVSFSGRMGGYGWLIIIDHPQANIYSLYGHLSPSRWRIKSGSVEKGDLIAYLGNPDENGGSTKNPLPPHLHFGVRAGQRTDYPGMGEWRWQAGWIRPCPLDVGWLQPSQVITSQDIPPRGFPEPTVGLLEKWSVELALVAIYLVGAACALVYAVSRNKPFVPVVSGGLMIVAGWLLFNKGTRVSYAIFSMAVLLIASAIPVYIRHAKGRRTANLGD